MCPFYLRHMTRTEKWEEKRWWETNQGCLEISDESDRRHGEVIKIWLLPRKEKKMTSPEVTEVSYQLPVCLSTPTSLPSLPSRPLSSHSANLVWPSYCLLYILHLPLLIVSAPSLCSHSFPIITHLPSSVELQTLQTAQLGNKLKRTPGCFTAEVLTEHTDPIMCLFWLVNISQIHM